VVLSAEAPISLHGRGERKTFAKEPRRTVRNSALRLSGSSERPAYPGFMVMNALHVGRRGISDPSKKNVFTLFFTAI
jgi:hypothetical protein